MIWWMTVAALLLPALMLGFRFTEPRSAFWFDTAALICLYAFGILCFAAVANTIIEGAESLTEIHNLFLSPVWLTSGGYLGVYVLYRSWIDLFRRYREM
ncbi:hypothetical protein O9H85_27005 [Paenibacillus filicis]|uniref:Transposase n=1 Tax=Paenibacillus gyeongsangnamensis TaxID=3388067 RepID=A0ABT4QGI1_9BACL|nr:hypothetical protein [Paenibacillus filicis]MCZ8515985.1 hypothetical protein [Paenibacillus filicis]